MTTSSSSTRITSSPPDTTTVSSTTNTDAWKYRRRFMLWITLFDMAVVILSLLFAKHESVAQLAVISGFGSLTAIFGFYVGGAVFDDHSTRQANLRGLQIASRDNGGREDCPEPETPPSQSTPPPRRDEGP